MDHQKILSLHETASEHYLRGEFREAVDAWKALLAIDPADEQALEGVRLAQMLFQGGGGGGDADPRDAEGRGRAGSPAAAEQELAGCSASPEAGEAADETNEAEIEADVNRSVSVLDSLSAGIDGAKLEETEPAGPPGEDPVVRPPEVPVEAAPGTPTPAEVELRRRIDDLVDEAKREASADRIDEALSILSRIFILDENDARAHALEEQLRAARGQSNHEVEVWVGEGIQEFERGKLDLAREAFQRVLGRCPGHAEAVDYLERIDASLVARERGAAEKSEAARGDGPSEPVRFDENLLSGQPGKGPAEPGRAPGSDPADLSPPSTESIPLARRKENPAEAPAAARPEAARASFPAAAVSLPSAHRGARRLLLGVGLLVVLGAAGAGIWLVPRFLGSGNASPVAAPVVVPHRAPKPAPPQPRPELPSRSIEDALLQARSAFASQDYAAAILAYDEVLKRDPTHEEARSGLRSAGERYKEQKAEIEQIERAKDAFTAEEFASALRILYRVPKGRHNAEIETYTFNAWFNLGLVSLRGANFKQAITSFDEALAIRPGDPAVRQVRELAVRTQSGVPDRGFYDRVERIPLRKIGE